MSKDKQISCGQDLISPPFLITGEKKESKTKRGINGYFQIQVRRLVNSTTRSTH